MFSSFHFMHICVDKYDRQIAIHNNNRREQNKQAYEMAKEDPPTMKLN
jgi:hypothetical protein